jgi:hypothetical protein
VKCKSDLIIFLNNGSSYKKLVYGMKRSWHSSVIIITGYGLDGPGIRAVFPTEARDFSLLHSIQTRFWGPPILLSNK